MNLTRNAHQWPDFNLLRCAILAFCLLLGLAVTHPALTAFAQDQKETNDKGVILKMPEGFMPVPLPNGLKGIMMLQAKRPAGMFIYYPAEGQTLADINKAVRPIFAPMFIHEEKKDEKEKTALTWAETALPAHENANIVDETGLLSLTTSKDMEVQVATYLGTVRGRRIAYGYFGMRHQKAKDDDAPFLDSKGQGVKEFDKFYQTFK